MDKRGILAIVLSLLVIFLWQAFFAKQPPPKHAPTSKEERVATQTHPVTPSPPVKQAQTRTILTQKEVSTEKEITVDTPLYTAVFSTKGGTLKSFTLKGYRKSIAKDSDPIELVHLGDGTAKPLTVTFPGSNIDIRGDSTFTVNTHFLDLTQKPEVSKLIFTQTHPRVATIEKIFTFYPDRYPIELEVKIHNLTKEAISQSALLSWYQYVDPKAESDDYGHEGPISYISKNIETFEAKKIEGEKTLGPDVIWAGFENKYFIASMIPQHPTLTSLILNVDAKHTVSVSLKGPENIIPAGQTGSFLYSLYLGPKDHDVLKSLGVGLENAIDFGSWLKWLALPLLISLKFINSYVHNYGIAIIILTVLIKILFWPLGNKSYKSMKELQKIQPKLRELQEKYKNDRAKLGQETMALYKAHNVNPLGGCLPMLIQIPVFFGLYKALMYSIELRHAPFIWWIQDLSAKDPYYITPIIMGGTMLIQQKMSPPMGDPIQQKVMLLMPVFFTFLFLNFPSGLVIYWLFQNILSIGQQYYINKRPY